MNLPRLRPLFESALLGLLSISALGLTMRTTLVPRDESAGVAVVFAPWVTDAAAMTRAADAGARFVRFGAAPFVAVVIPNVDGYASRILADGALLVVEPALIAACLKPFAGAKNS